MVLIADFMGDFHVSLSYVGLRMICRCHQHQRRSNAERKECIVATQQSRIDYHARNNGPGTTVKGQALVVSGSVSLLGLGIHVWGFTMPSRAGNIRSGILNDRPNFLLLGFPQISFCSRSAKTPMHQHGVDDNSSTSGIPLIGEDNLRRSSILGPG